MNAGILTAIAFNDPQKLTAEGQAAMDAARHTPASKKADAAEWRAAAERLTAAVERGRVLED